MSKARRTLALVALALLVTTLGAACKSGSARRKSASAGPTRAGIEDLSIVRGEGALASLINYLLPRKRKDDSHWLEGYEKDFAKPRWRVVRDRFAHLVAAAQHGARIAIAWQDKDVAMIGARRGAVIEAREQGSGKLLWRQVLGKRAFVAPRVLALPGLFISLTRGLSDAKVMFTGHAADSGKTLWRHEVTPTQAPPEPLREAVTLAVGRDLRVMVRGRWLLVGTGVAVHVIDTRDGKRHQRAGPGPLCHASGSGPAVLARYPDGKGSGLELHTFDATTGRFGGARAVLPTGNAPGRVVRISGERVVLLAQRRWRGRKTLSNKRLGVRGGRGGRGRRRDAKSKKKRARRGALLVAYSVGKRKPIWQLELSKRRTIYFRPDCARAHQGRFEPFVVDRSRRVVLVDLVDGKARWSSGRAKKLRVGSVARARGAVVLGLVATPPISAQIDPASSGAGGAGSEADDPSRSAPPELLIIDSARGTALGITARALTGVTAAEAQVARQIRDGVWFGIVPRQAHETFKRAKAHAMLRWRVDLSKGARGATVHGGGDAVVVSQALSRELGALPLPAGK